MVADQVVRDVGLLAESSVIAGHERWLAWRALRAITGAVADAEFGDVSRHQAPNVDLSSNR